MAGSPVGSGGPTARRLRRRLGGRRLAGALGLALAAWAGVPGRLDAQLAPPATGGAVELDRLLQRLSEPRRVLVIGAHPDDEDTELLTFAAQGLGARAAYLALSRGEGGQNLIGEELGEALGLLRTRELLAARATDGAEQFFTRAYDFGFSKSLEETLRFWPADSLLKDAVRIVRRFRPHVIVSVFSGTPRDGHGQHQAAGLVARRVFEAAGDSTAFPELWSEEGLAPWQPLKLYQSTRFDPNSTTVRLATGALDPRSGRSYHQIAMASRSRHRSQDMGQLQELGPSQARLGLIRDRTARADGIRPDDLFAGIPRPENWLVRLADSLRQVASPLRLGDLARSLAQALARLDRGELEVDPVTRGDLERALAIAAGLELDALATAEALTPGDTMTVTVQVYNAGPLEAALDSIAFQHPAGWRIEATDSIPARLAPGTLLERRFRVRLPSQSPPTQPYFLERPRIGALYDWSQAPPAVRGEPFEPPVLAARAWLRVAGAALGLEREASYRYRDQALGEIRRPLRIVPAVGVRLEPDVMVWPAAAGDRRAFTVTVRSYARGPVAGEVQLETDGWPAPPAVPFTLRRPGEIQSFRVDLVRPRGLEAARVTVRAIARTSEGQESRADAAILEYPHIRPTPYLVPARAEVRLAPIALPKLARVGYVRGASDRVPEALQQVGVPIVLLGPRELAEGDLGRFDAIVIGSRAYETDSALVHHHGRLLDYLSRGGRLIVQYQQYPFIQGNFAPYPLTIARPHDRVTDETAPVRLLVPEHPAFTSPNRLTAADWEGWPQERGLYFAHTWDPAYTPLLETHDPGEAPLEGGLLVARVGRGLYVYTGLAFFRALPAGVPGAYRLFLNLLALPVR